VQSCTQEIIPQKQKEDILSEAQDQYNQSCKSAVSKIFLFWNADETHPSNQASEVQNLSDY
jgi:hypothetical protein